MAHYLLRVGHGEYGIREADSAKQAVDSLNLDDGEVEVWTLRNSEPRVFTVSVETTRTIKQT